MSKLMKLLQSPIARRIATQVAVFVVTILTTRKRRR